MIQVLRVFPECKSQIDRDETEEVFFHDNEWIFTSCENDVTTTRIVTFLYSIYVAFWWIFNCNCCSFEKLTHDEMRNLPSNFIYSHNFDVFSTFLLVFYVENCVKILVLHVFYKTRWTGGRMKLGRWDKVIKDFSDKNNYKKRDRVIWMKLKKAFLSSLHGLTTRNQIGNYLYL